MTPAEKEQEEKRDRLAAEFKREVDQIKTKLVDGGAVIPIELTSDEYKDVFQAQNRAAEAYKLEQLARENPALHAELKASADAKAKVEELQAEIDKLKKQKTK